MASVNSIILIGHLGRAPEKRLQPGGTETATLNVATTDRRKNPSTGVVTEHTEWHKVELESWLIHASEGLAKGSKVYIEGSIRSRPIRTAQGQPQRYTTFIRASIVAALGSQPTNQRHHDEQPYY